MPAPESSLLKEKVRHLPHRPGVYLMKDRLARIIYVGKAKDLKKRVSSYFQPSRRFTAQQPKIAVMVDLIHGFDVIEVKSEAEALLLEGKLIKQWKPKYNTDFTDDKRFLLVRVDRQNEMPRFRLTRFRNEDASAYYGPFAHSGLLRKTLSQMRLRFGILLGDARPIRQPDGSWHLYEDVRKEIYGHPNHLSSEQYCCRVDEACVFLEGKSRQWLVELKAEMMAAAEKRQYEKAAYLRNIVFALEKTVLKTRKFSRPFGPSDHAAIDEALAELQEKLRLPGRPEQMECFDISHISGTFVVASMVRFSGGRPDRKKYRHYKIRSFIGNDDFRAMEEVVGRRYRRLLNEKKPLPDLILIDGGKGQLTSALKAFIALEIEPPAMAGLAKRRETLIFTDEREPLNLPARSEGLKMLQRLRDEAHRFANTYNAQLRSRRMKETVLDDLPGLGPVRRNALLNHFKTTQRLKKATPQELRAVDGIGEKNSLQLHRYLRNL